MLSEWSFITSDDSQQHYDHCDNYKNVNKISSNLKSPSKEPKDNKYYRDSI